MHGHLNVKHIWLRLKRSIVFAEFTEIRTSRQISIKSPILNSSESLSDTRGQDEANSHFSLLCERVEIAL